MNKKQLAEILSTLNEKDRNASEALSRANKQFSSGQYDEAQESYTESTENRAYRNGIIDTLAILGYVAGRARNMDKWIIVQQH